MKLILETSTEERLIHKPTISIDELVGLFNLEDLDRNIDVVVDSKVFNP